MKKRKLLLIIVLVIIAAGAYLYFSSREKVPDPSNDKPDAVITASALLEAFDKDTLAARKSYVNKLLQVSGEVISVDSLGAVVLGEQGQASSVSVSLDTRHIEEYRKLKTGSPAVLKGWCTGYSKAEGEDLLASLGTTVELNFASVVEPK